MTRTPEDFKWRSSEDEGRMDPEEIRVERDDEIEGMEKAIQRVTRKADHELDPHLEVPLLQPGDGRNRICCGVASVGEEEHFIDHRLHSDFHGLYPVLLEQEENRVTQGVRPGRNADGINPSGSKERLNLLQIRDLIFLIHRRETSSVEGNLFFPVPVAGRDLLK